jgi:hypothetical protein
MPFPLTMITRRRKKRRRKKKKTETDQNWLPCALKFA